MQCPLYVQQQQAAVHNPAQRERGRRSMQTSAIMDLARAHAGVVTSAMVDQYGLSRGVLKHLVDTGHLVRRARGVYCVPGTPPDFLFDLQVQYARGIYSHTTALMLLGLIDGDPERDAPHMTFPAGYNTSGVRDRGVVPHVAKEGMHELGRVRVRTASGCEVWSYNAERALCMAAKAAHAPHDSQVQDAFARYARTSGASADALMRHAVLLRVERRVRPYAREVKAWRSQGALG